MCLRWGIFTSEWIECSKPPSLNINIVTILSRLVLSPGVTPCLCSRWVTPGSRAWGGLKAVGGFPEWRDQKDHRDPEACRENRVPPACLASRAPRWVAGSVHSFSVGTPSHSTRGRGRLASPDTAPGQCGQLSCCKSRHLFLPLLFVYPVTDPCLWFRV